MFTIKYNKRKDDDLSWEALNELHFILVGILGFIIAFVQDHSLWIRILLVTSASLFIVIPRVINVQSDKLYITVNSKVINGHLAYFRYREFAGTKFSISNLQGRQFLADHFSIYTDRMVKRLNPASGVLREVIKKNLLIRLINIRTNIIFH
jgi:hypothetical protein